MNRRNFLAASAALLAAPAIVRDANAQAITLRLHHFLGPQSNGHAKMLAPWAAQVAAATQDRLRVEIFPGMQLGGTPPQLYNQARDGVVDLVWTLPGNTPGRFPLTEVFELPFIASNRGLTNALACQEFAEQQLIEETRDTKILSFWSHDAGLIHSNKEVRTMEDLRGLKLRNPTRLAGEALRALGATPVGMPVPQVPESIAQRVIDGAVIPWEVVPAVRVHELVNHHTAIPGAPTLYTASFFLAMNRPRYEGLPAELRTALDRVSGAHFARLAGNMWDTEARTVEAMVRARPGNTIVSITEAEKARWVAATQPVYATWIEQMRGRNVDGARMIETARGLIAKHANAQA